MPRRHSKTSDPAVGSTRLVRLIVANHSPDELALGWLRYECVRTMNPRTFGELCRRNIAGDRFDDIVTEAVMQWKPNH